MFTVKAIGPNKEVHGYEARRFTINELRSTVMFLEPGSDVYIDIHVDRPDGHNHVFIENSMGKTIESLHRGSVKTPG